MAFRPKVDNSTAAVFCSGSCVCHLNCYERPLLIKNRLEQAAEPENLAQETIIENLAPKEAERLSRVRNIGIAVSYR